MARGCLWSGYSRHDSGSLFRSILASRRTATFAAVRDAGIKKTATRPPMKIIPRVFRDSPPSRDAIARFTDRIARATRGEKRAIFGRSESPTPDLPAVYCKKLPTYVSNFAKRKTAPEGAVRRFVVAAGQLPPAGCPCPAPGRQRAPGARRRNRDPLVPVSLINIGYFLTSLLHLRQVVRSHRE